MDAYYYYSCFDLNLADDDVVLARHHLESYLVDHCQVASFVRMEEFYYSLEKTSYIAATNVDEAVEMVDYLKLISGSLFSWCNFKFHHA